MFAESAEGHLQQDLATAQVAPGKLHRDGSLAGVVVVVYVGKVRLVAVIRQQQAKIPGDFYPYSAVFTDTQHGWVSGLAGVFLYTGDGGKTWTKQVNRTGAPMYALVHAIR